MITRNPVTFTNKDNRILSDIRSNKDEIEDNDEDILMNNRQIVQLNDNVNIIMNTSNRQQEQLNKKANKDHEHEIKDIKDLQDKLDNKLERIHQHEIYDIKDLPVQLSLKANQSQIYRDLRKEISDRERFDDYLYDTLKKKIDTNVINIKDNHASVEGDIRRVTEKLTIYSPYQNQVQNFIVQSGAFKRNTGLKYIHRYANTQTLNSTRIPYLYSNKHNYFLGHTDGEQSFICFGDDTVCICSPGDIRSGVLHIFDEDRLRNSTSYYLPHTTISDTGDVRDYSSIYFKDNFRYKDPGYKNYFDTLQKIKLYTYTMKYNTEDDSEVNDFSEEKKQRIKRKSEKLHFGLKFEELQESDIFGHIFRQNFKDEGKKVDFEIQDRKLNNKSFQYYIILALQSLQQYYIQPFLEQLQQQQEAIDQLKQGGENREFGQKGNIEYIFDEIKDLMNVDNRQDQIIKNLNNKFDMYIKQTANLIKDQKDIQKRLNSVEDSIDRLNSMMQTLIQQQ